MTGKSRHLLLLGLVVVIQGTIYIFKPNKDTVYITGVKGLGQLIV